MMGEKHKELQRTAIRWLYDRGCNIFANEVPTRNGYADALGVRIGAGNEITSYYFEAKASRADLISQKQQECYARSIESNDSEFGCPEIDFYYLIVADGINVEPSLYPLWGVINEKGIVIRKAKRFKHKKDKRDLIHRIAHVLVYKVFGKLYLGQMPKIEEQVIERENNKQQLNIFTSKE